MPLTQQDFLDGQNWINQQYQQAGYAPWQFNGDYKWGARPDVDRAIMAMAKSHGATPQDVANFIGMGDPNQISQDWNTFFGSRQGNDATQLYGIDRGFISSNDRPNSNPGNWYFDANASQSGFNSPFGYNAPWVDTAANGSALDPAILAARRQRNNPALSSRPQNTQTNQWGPSGTPDLNTTMTRNRMSAGDTLGRPQGMIAQGSTTPLPGMIHNTPNTSGVTPPGTIPVSGLNSMMSRPNWGPQQRIGGGKGNGSTPYFRNNGGI